MTTKKTTRKTSMLTLKAAALEYARQTGLQPPHVATISRWTSTGIQVRDDRGRSRRVFLRKRWFGTKKWFTRETIVTFLAEIAK